MKYNAIVAAAIATVLGVHGAAPTPPCIGEKYACPEPELPPADMREFEHQNPQTLYGVQTAVLGTATGPVTLSLPTAVTVSP
jgi:hypothetical protein